MRSKTLIRIAPALILITSCGGAGDPLVGTWQFMVETSTGISQTNQLTFYGDHSLLASSITMYAPTAPSPYAGCTDVVSLSGTRWSNALDAGTQTLSFDRAHQMVTETRNRCSSGTANLNTTTITLDATSPLYFDNGTIYSINGSTLTLGGVALTRAM